MTENHDYTIQLDTKIYQIARQDICTGLRGAVVRVEKRRDGSVAVRFRDRYLRIAQCAQRPKVTLAKPAKSKRQAQPAKPREWNKHFDLKKAPKIWQAAQESGSRYETRSEADCRTAAGRGWREGKVRPLQGNSPHDRPVSRDLLSPR